MSEPSVTLTVRWGAFGENCRAIAIPLDEALRREMMEPQEVTDNLLSLALRGMGRPSLLEAASATIEHRKKVFRMREDTASQIAESIRAELLRVFGEHDVVDGYQGDSLERRRLHAQHHQKARKT